MACEMHIVAIGSSLHHCFNCASSINAKFVETYCATLCLCLLGQRIRACMRSARVERIPVAAAAAAAAAVTAIHVNSFQVLLH